MPGDDVLVAGPGEDALAGQAGADIFVLSQGAVGRVQDFTFAAGDRLAIEGVTDVAAFLAGLGSGDGEDGLVLSAQWPGLRRACRTPGGRGP